MNVPNFAEAMDAIGRCATAVNLAQGKLAPLIVNVPGANELLAEAQARTSELGDRHLVALERIRRTIAAMPEPTSTPPVIAKPPAIPPATPPVDPGPLPPAGKGVTIVRWAPGPRLNSMDREFMRTPVMAYQFVARDGAVGKATSYEYGGDARMRDSCISETDGDFDSPLARASFNGGASSTIIWIKVGAGFAKIGQGNVEIAPGVYYHNIRGGERGPLGGWDAEFARQQYGVGNSVAA